MIWQSKSASGRRCPGDSPSLSTPAGIFTSAVAIPLFLFPADIGDVLRLSAFPLRQRTLSAAGSPETRFAFLERNARY